MMPSFDSSMASLVQISDDAIASKMQARADTLGQRTGWNLQMRCEDPWHDDATNKDLMSEEQMDHHMPPPKPYFIQSTSLADSITLLRGSQRILLGRQLSSELCKQEQPEKNVLNARVSTQSLQNVHSSRSVHNRILGHVLLAKPSESGNSAKSQLRRARIEELDILLRDL